MRSTFTAPSYISEGHSYACTWLVWREHIVLKYICSFTHSRWTTRKTQGLMWLECGRTGTFIHRWSHKGGSTWVMSAHHKESSIRLLVMSKTSLKVQTLLQVSLSSPCRSLESPGEPHFETREPDTSKCCLMRRQKPQSEASRFWPSLGRAPTQQHSAGEC